MDPHAPDARLSNYRLERLLGAGGMGAVYLAHDLTLQRRVAIKFISPELAGDDAARRRLIREARAAAALDHPNICAVHEVVVTAEGQACLVMQHIEGETLAEALRRGPLEPRRALEMASALASALGAAHRQGIVHRDIKPQNVMITPSGGVKLLDFGIARLADAAGSDETRTRLTHPGTVAGTPAYMSPEQVRQQPLDGRSDLFSLGAVLYEALTGRRAFSGASVAEIYAGILHEHPPAPSEVREGLSPQHDEVCRRLLAKDPNDRFASADEVAGALRVLVPDTAHATGDVRTRTGGAELLPRWIRVRPMPAALAASALLAIGALALASAWRAPTPVAAAPATIGVLPFTNQTADERFEPLLAGMPEVLAARLSSAEALRVLPSAEIREALRDSADPGAVSRALGATLMIEGTLSGSGTEAELTTALIGPDGRRRPAGRHPATGSALELHQRMAEGVLAALAREGVTKDAALPASTPPTGNAEAFAEYSQARAFAERPDVPGNLDHAIRLFQSAADKDPRFALAHAGLAEAYWSQYRETKDPAWTAKAMAANLEALRIDPARAEVRLSLAVMYNGQGRRDEAAEEARRVLALQPSNDGARRLLADIHMAGGRWDAAIAEATEAVRLRPSYWRNHSTLGLACFRAGRYDEAASHYERVVQLQPDSARGYQTLGTVLQAAGRNDEALAQYEKAIAINPTWGTYSNVGTLYFWRGDFVRAAAAYEKAIALSPNDPQLHANLGDARARLGRRGDAAASYRQALAHVQTLLAVRPNDAHQLAALALYEAKLGQRRSARQAMEKALALAPADGEVLYVAALVHALASERDAACTRLGEAVAAGASLEEIRHAGELAGLNGCAAYDRVREGAPPVRGQ